MTDPVNVASTTATTTDTPKMVPESDLLKVKAASKKAAGEFKTQIDELTSSASEHRANLIKADAAREQLEEKLNKSSALATSVEEVQAKLDAETKSVKELTDKLLAGRRTNITTKFNVPAEKLDGKTEAELDLLEDALGSVPQTTRPANGFATGIATGSPPATTAMDVALADIKKAKERAGVKVN